MKIGDLVKFKNPLNFSPSKKDILGIIVDMNRIASASTKYMGIREEFLGVEYEVKIITNNKTAWYIEDNLELVSEGWRFSQKQGDG